MAIMSSEVSRVEVWKYMVFARFMVMSLFCGRFFELYILFAD